MRPDHDAVRTERFALVHDRLPQAARKLLLHEADYVVATSEDGSRLHCFQHEDDLRMENLA
jgi:hypothetical protein